MFCDPVEILRYRIDLVVERAIGELRRFFDEIVVPHEWLRQLNQAVTYSAAMFAQPLNLIPDRRDRDQVHSVLLLDIRNERWTLPCIFDQHHAWSIFPNEQASL